MMVWKPFMLRLDNFYYRMQLRFSRGGSFFRTEDVFFFFRKENFFEGERGVRLLQRGFVRFEGISKGVRPNPSNPPPLLRACYVQLKDASNTSPLLILFDNLV